MAHGFGHGVLGQRLLVGQPRVWLRRAEPGEGARGLMAPRRDVLGHLPVVRPLSSGKSIEMQNFQKISLVWSNTFRLSTYHSSLGYRYISLYNPPLVHIRREIHINRGSLSIVHPDTNKQSIKFQGKNLSVPKKPGLVRYKMLCFLDIKKTPF